MSISCNSCQNEAAPNSRPLDALPVGVLASLLGATGRIGGALLALLLGRSGGAASAAGGTALSSLSSSLLLLIFVVFGSLVST